MNSENHGNLSRLTILYEQLEFYCFIIAIVIAVTAVKAVGTGLYINSESILLLKVHTSSFYLLLCM